jgi:hypothetical protein
MIWQITIGIVLAGIILALLPYLFVIGAAVIVAILQLFTKKVDHK